MMTRCVDVGLSLRRLDGRLGGSSRIAGIGSGARHGELVMLFWSIMYPRCIWSLSLRCIWKMDFGDKSFVKVTIAERCNAYFWQPILHGPRYLISFWATERVGQSLVCDWFITWNRKCTRPDYLITLPSRTMHSRRRPNLFMHLVWIGRCHLSLRFVCTTFLILVDSRSVHLWNTYLVAVVHCNVV